MCLTSWRLWLVTGIRHSSTVTFFLFFTSIKVGTGAADNGAGQQISREAIEHNTDSCELLMTSVA